MKFSCTLRTLLKLALIKWRFRDEPRLVKIYMSKRVDYLPSHSCIKNIELDVSSSKHVKSISVLLRSHDVWFLVKEKSGKVILFNDRLSPENTMHAQQLEVLVAVDTLVHNLPMWRAEKLYHKDWLSLVRDIAKDYHHNLK